MIHEQRVDTFRSLCVDFLMLCCLRCFFFQKFFLVLPFCHGAWVGEVRLGAVPSFLFYPFFFVSVLFAPLGVSDATPNPLADLHVEISVFLHFPGVFSIRFAPLSTFPEAAWSLKVPFCGRFHMFCRASFPPLFPTFSPLIRQIE